MRGKRGILAPLVVACAASLTASSLGMVRSQASALSPQHVLVDGVALTVAAPFLSDHTLHASAAGNAHQVAAAFGRNGRESLSIIAVPYGTQPAGEALPRATAGSGAQLGSASASHWLALGATAAGSMAATVFSQTVVGRSFVWGPGSAGSGPGGSRALSEWVAEACSHLWMIRAEGPDHATVQAGASGLSISAAGAAVRSTLIAPAAPAPAADNPGSLGDVPWWNGACDAAHYLAVSGVEPHPMQASFLGLQACWPRPVYGEGPDVPVTFSGAQWSVLEFECVELSLRFMQLAWGVHPYPANGVDVVPGYYPSKGLYNPSGPNLTVQRNDGSAAELTPGDVLSESDSSSAGHTAVVNWAALDATGSGRISVLEENASSSGSESYSVSRYVIQDSWSHITGWLHNPSWSSPSSANLLHNASFEPGVGGSWQFDAGHQMTVSSRSGGAADGRSYLEVSSGLSGGSVYEDVPAVVMPSRDDTLSIWVRSPGGQPAAGTLALWAMADTPNEGVATPFVAGATWTLVTATLDPQQSHATLRAQIFLDTAGASIDLDGAQLTPQLLRNADFASPSALRWQWDQTAQMNLMVYGGGARDGANYLETNTGIAGGSVYQDAAAGVSPGQDDTFSIWLRSPSGQPASGVVALWALGSNPTEGGTTPFVAGATWTLVTTTLDPQQAHTALRAQVYLNTTGVSLDLNGAQLTPQLLHNASFDNPASLGWQLDQGTQTAALLVRGSGAMDGPAYLKMTTGVSGGSLCQDVAVSVSPGQDDTFSIWVRSGGAQPASGILALWGLGVNPTEGVATPFVTGPGWTLVTTTIDPLEAHSSLRAQVYLTPTHTYLDLDGAKLTPQ
jgi:hypothetical protein